MRIDKLKSSELKSAVLGMALGDAHIDTTYSNCRMDIYVDHKNEDFAIMKYELLKQVGNLEVKIKEKVDKRILKDGSQRRGYRIQTKIHPYITKIKNIQLFKKAEMLNLLGWAIWYMDDGSLCIRKNGNFAGCYLAMNRYPLEFVEHCQRVLLIKYNIRANIQRHSPNKNQYLLRFTYDETVKLHSLIKKYIVPSMTYKILEECRGSEKETLQDIV